jgi:hypothetical protein
METASKPMLTQWGDWIDALAAYRSEHGDADVPATYVAPSGHRLGRWLTSRKKEYRAGKLTSDEIEALFALEVGFIPSAGARPILTRWHDWITVLTTYRDAHGDGVVPLDYVAPTGHRLGKWLADRKKAFRAGRLTADQARALVTLGVDLAPTNAAQSPARAAPPEESDSQRWERRLALVAAYRAEHGHTEIPNSYLTSDGHRIGTWLAQIRRQYRAGALPPEQAAALRALGYDVAHVGRFPARPRPKPPPWKPAGW